MSTSTIEVVKSLNPLYYSFPKLTTSTEYKIFKNLNTKIVINLEEELIKHQGHYLANYALLIIKLFPTQAKAQ